jgi:hypothetical protein
MCSFSFPGKPPGHPRHIISAGYTTITVETGFHLGGSHLAFNFSGTQRYLALKGITLRGSLLQCACFVWETIKQFDQEGFENLF